MTSFTPEQMKAKFPTTPIQGGGSSKSLTPAEMAVKFPDIKTPDPNQRPLTGAQQMFGKDFGTLGFLKTVFPVLGDIHTGVPAKKIFADTVSSGLNLVSFFIAPEATPELIAGEQSAKLTAEQIAKQVAEKSAKTFATKLTEKTAFATKLGILTGGSTLAQDIGTGDKTPDQMTSDTITSALYGAGTVLGLEVLTPIISGLTSLGINGAKSGWGFMRDTGYPAIKNLLTDSGKADLVTQFEKNTELTNKIQSSMNKVVTSTTPIEKTVVDKVSAQARAVEDEHQQAAIVFKDTMEKQLTSGQDLSNTSNKIVDNVNNFDTNFQTQKDALYQKSIPANTPVDLTATKASLEASIKELSKSKAPASSELKYLQSLLDNLSPATKIGKIEVPGLATKTMVDELRATQSSLKSKLPPYGQPLSFEQTKILDAVNAMDKDISNVLKTQNPEAYNALQQANDLYKNKKNIIDKNPLINIVKNSKDNPDLMMKKIVDLATSSKIGDRTTPAMVADFYNAIGDQKIPFQESLIKEMITNATDKGSRLISDPASIKSLNNSILNIQKTGLLGGHTEAVLGEFKTLLSDIASGDAINTTRLANLQNQPTLLEQAQKLSETQKSSGQYQDILKQIKDKAPEDVVPKIMKMDSVESKKVYDALSPEEKTQMGDAVVKHLGETDVTPDTISQLYKDIQDPKGKGVFLKGIFSPEDLNAMKQISEGNKNAKLLKQITSTKMKMGFHSALTVVEALHGNPFVLGYMGLKTADDFVRLQALEKQLPTGDLSSLEPSFKKKWLDTQKKIQDILGPMLRGGAVSNISSNQSNQ